MKKIILFMFITVSLFAEKMTYSDPQPTFDNPRKWVVNLSTNDVERVNHIISSINNVLKEYPQGAMQVAVVAYSSGMRVLKKDYDPNTLTRIKKPCLIYG